MRLESGAGDPVGESDDASGGEWVNLDPRTKVVSAMRAQTRWWRRFFFIEVEDEG